MMSYVSSGFLLTSHRYTFPLYDGVSVISFECELNDRIIRGVVKEKDEAKATYQEAKDKGQTAGLLEQLPAAADVFTTTISNVPAGSNITVNIVYVGELRHDAEVDGLRYTMPTAIAPRYGIYPGELLNSNVAGKGLDITVDINLDSTSRVQRILSPTHQISIGIGTLSDTPDAEPVLFRGSATLATGQSELSNDFVLQIVARDSGIPRALLETHPTISNHRALCTTLVPKFNLKPIRPEIIFVADRSGSMAGNIETLKAALHVFLKSLPVGVKFNICSFGSSWELLWPKSAAYNQTSLEEAQNYVGTFHANFGGTETFQAVKGAIQSRFKEIETEIMLLTDGDIWAQEQLFSYLSGEVEESKGLLRLFPIGIGGGVSSALVEGVARAGNGFSQLIANGEKLDGKMVRMLKGALTPHVNDYSLEVNYGSDASTNDDNFVVVEKIADSLSVDLTLEESARSITSGTEQKPISLFDPDAGSSIDVDSLKSTGNKYSHLPDVQPPKLLQTPHKIPPLFPFSRFHAYVLMSPETSRLRPISVTLRGTCNQGPLELQIPIEHLPESGTTLHCLAAKKAIQELEEGQGWVHNAIDVKNQNELLKNTLSARFDEIVEREAVRLGVEFQVGGKWCSFVAVEGNDQVSKVKDNAPAPPANAPGIKMDTAPMCSYQGDYRGQYTRKRKAIAVRGGGRGGGLFGAGRVLRGGGGPSRNAPVESDEEEDEEEEEEDCGFCLSDDAAPASQPTTKSATSSASSPATAPSSNGMRGFRARTSTLPKTKSASRGASKVSNSSILDDKNAQTDNASALTYAIIDAQTFTGSWDKKIVASAAIGIDEERFKVTLSKAPKEINKAACEAALTTAIVVRFLELKLDGMKDTWELVVEKAKAVIEGMGDEISEFAWKAAEGLIS